MVKNINFYRERKLNVYMDTRQQIKNRFQRISKNKK